MTRRKPSQKSTAEQEVSRKIVRANGHSLFGLEIVRANGHSLFGLQIVRANDFLFKPCTNLLEIYKIKKMMPELNSLKPADRNKRLIYHIPQLATLTNTRTLQQIWKVKFAFIYFDCKKLCQFLPSNPDDEQFFVHNDIAWNKLYQPAIWELQTLGAAFCSAALKDLMHIVGREQLSYEQAKREAVRLHQKWTLKSYVRFICDYLTFFSWTDIQK
jgi:hypothetical protein